MSGIKKKKMKKKKRDTPSPLLRNLGAEFSEMSFSHFTTYFMQIGHCYLKTTIKLFHSDSNVLFPKCMTHKKKSCVYFSTFPYIFIHFPCENPIGLQLLFFKILFYLILVNLQAFARGKKCCFRW